MRAILLTAAPSLCALALASPIAEASKLRGASTGRQAELRKTVPIASHAGQRTRSVLSLKLPRLRRGDRIRFNGEVTLSTTCVEQISRCIGRSYRFDPHLRAQVTLAGSRNAAGPGVAPVSKAVSLTCEQTRPNRNHHCPLVVRGGSFSVRKLRRLPCNPRRCRLNMLVDAHHSDVSGGEVVVVGSDQKNGTVEGGKARLSAAVSTGRIDIDKRRTAVRVHKQLQASFDGGKRVVYSQRLDNLQAGDVLLVRSRQRTAIRRYPYFVSNQIVVSTKRKGTKPSKLARRTVSRTGTATETNGFNCTLGPSAFRNPCVSPKAGLARIERVPRNRRGRKRPLYVNVVSRAFPKLAQARGYPPARILKGGSLTVRRLRAR